MARHAGEKKMALRITRLSMRVMELEQERTTLERELVFARAHLGHHHPADGKTCGWERDFIVRMELAMQQEQAAANEAANGETHEHQQV